MFHRRSSRQYYSRTNNSYTALERSNQRETDPAMAADSAIESAESNSDPINSQVYENSNSNSCFAPSTTRRELFSDDEHFGDDTREMSIQTEPPTCQNRTPIFSLRTDSGHFMPLTSVLQSVNATIESGPAYYYPSYVPGNNSAEVLPAHQSVFEVTPNGAVQHIFVGYFFPPVPVYHTE